LLAAAGARLKQALALARQSNTKLTMGRCGRAQFNDLGGAGDRLPTGFQTAPVVPVTCTNFRWWLRFASDR
jgi:hypothetical protein